MPLADAADAAAEAAHSPVAPAPADRLEGAGRTPPSAPERATEVLVFLPAEDPLAQEPGWRTNAAFAATVVHDASAALHALFDRAYDVMLVDTALPDANVVTFVRQALRIRAGVAVLAVTAAPASLEATQLLALGIEQVLVRPLTAADLTRALEHTAARLRANRPHEAAGTPHYHDHLARLLRITSDILMAESYMDAMRVLAGNLRELFPGRAIGILDAEPREGHLYVSLTAGDGTATEQRLVRALLTRCEQLTGRSVEHGGMTICIESDATAASAPSSTKGNPERDFLLPFLGAGEVRGVLGLASMTEADYHNEHLPFLYLIASHLHPVIRALHRLARMAFRDALTGLYNRPYMEDVLGSAIERHRRYRHPLAVVMVDLDHFKGINDTVGHQGGDVALCEFARVLLGMTRGSDAVGRLGGDEFVILLPETGSPGLAAFLDRVLAQLASRTMTIDGVAVDLRASFGAAVLEAAEGEVPSAAEMISRADQALYASKRRGRACWTLWEPPTALPPGRPNSPRAAQEV